VFFHPSFAILIKVVLDYTIVFARKSSR